MECRLTEFREAKGLGLREVARAVGMSGSALQRYEQGTSGGRTLATLRKLARFYLVSVADLLVDADVPYRLAPEERTMIQRMRTLPPEARHRLAAVIEAYLAPRDGTTG